ncbi:YceI family protein [Gillisia hiemivivida]|uniref:YceI family protein n=1 Tax=Gillisia hiemivivida TaxID=291190 RepID=A0A5C6ZWM0_9FLAO|nr:YceI family protein [Gillisia hiemivivida]TXD94386.1 YceI family protein [Gillisia hiemivivida]
MKAYSTLIMLSAVLLFSFGVNAQSYNLNNKTSSLLIDGTSNIHDWTIEAENTGGLLSVGFDEGELEEIEKLEFTAVAESLVSGKSGMDKNTYKALNTDKYKNITYTLNKVNGIEKLSGNDYKVKTTGSLMIAGVKKDINLNFNLNCNSDQLVLKGQYKLNMTDFKIDPPTAMFGTIKTGEEVLIKFETHFNK